MQDDQGIVQLWTISPLGGEVHQVTSGSDSIESAFSWDSTGRYLTFVRKGLVMVCCAETGVCRAVTAPSAEPVSGDAVVFSPDNSRWHFCAAQTAGSKSGWQTPGCNGGRLLLRQWCQGVMGGFRCFQAFYPFRRG